MGGEGEEGLRSRWVPLSWERGSGFCCISKERVWEKRGKRAEKGRRTTLIVPSQELEQNVSLEMRFQCTAKTSLLCSFHDWIGNSLTPISNNLTEPSPAATTTWFSCVSDQARS